MALKITVHEKNLSEDALMEMATLRPKKSGLPVVLYIDDSGSYIRGKHAPRIKFELSRTSSPNTRSHASMATMDFNGEVITGKHPPKASDQITNSEIGEIRNFVKNNREALQLVADERIDYDDFVPIMIRGGRPATEQELQELSGKLKELTE